MQFLSSPGNMQSKQVSLQSWHQLLFPPNLWVPHKEDITQAEGPFGGVNKYKFALQLVHYVAKNPTQELQV